MYNSSTNSSSDTTLEQKKEELMNDILRQQNVILYLLGELEKYEKEKAERFAAKLEANSLQSIDRSRLPLAASNWLNALPPEQQKPTRALSTPTLIQISQAQSEYIEILLKQSKDILEKRGPGAPISRRITELENSHNRIRTYCNDVSAARLQTNTLLPTIQSSTSNANTPPRPPLRNPLPPPRPGLPSTSNVNAPLPPPSNRGSLSSPSPDFQPSTPTTNPPFSPLSNLGALLYPGLNSQPSTPTANPPFSPLGNLGESLSYPSLNPQPSMPNTNPPFSPLSNLGALLYPGLNSQPSTLTANPPFSPLSNQGFFPPSSPSGQPPAPTPKNNKRRKVTNQPNI